MHNSKKPCNNTRGCCRAFMATCILLLCAHSSRIYAQRYTISDSVIVLKLIQQSVDTDDQHPAAGLRLAGQATAIAKQINYTFGYALGLEATASAETFLGNPDTALIYYFQALKICNDNGYNTQAAYVHAHLGGTYDNKGNYKDAIAQYDTALKIYTSESDSDALGDLYATMAVTMNHMKDYDKAIAYSFRAIDFFSNLPLRTGCLYNNIGGDYVAQKRYPDAFRYLYMAVHISDSMHTTENLPLAFMNLGACYDGIGKKDSALYYYLKSLYLYRHLQDMQNQALLLGNLGAIYADLKNPGLAEKYLLESLQLARKTSNLAVICYDYRNLAGVYFQKKDLANAYKYEDSALVNSDLLYDRDQAQALADLTTKYETREIQHQNTVLQQENYIKQIKLQRKNILVYSVFGIALLFLVIAALIVRQSRLNAYRQKLELEQKQLLAQINPHFIFNCLNSIQQFVVQNDIINANKYLADFALLMRQTLDNSKDGVISLRREIEYLENYLSFEHMRFEDKFTAAIHCDPGINIDTAEIPSMIIQPFVENAIRHGMYNLVARKGILNISFYIKDRFLYCEVDDNGIGMEEAQKLKEQMFIKYHSHGMDLTRQRLALVSKLNSYDYKITVVNKKGPGREPMGTAIIIKFPLQV